MNIKKTLTTILLGATLGYTGCTQKEEPIELKVKNQLPQPLSNQAIIPNPKYLAGKAPPGYIFLTDINGDGTWDSMEKVNDKKIELTYKKGFGPSQGIPQGVKCEFVDSTYFNKYK